MTGLNLGEHHRGQALAEFALVFPILILLLLAIFDIGRAVFVYNSLTNAAREAARLAIVNQDQASVVSRAQEMAIGVGIATAPANVVRYFQPLPNTTNVTANQPCDNSDATHQLAVGCVAVITVDQQWQAITPVIGRLIGPINLQARSESVVEFVCPNATVPAFSTAPSCPKQP